MIRLLDLAVSLACALWLTTMLGNVMGLWAIGPPCLLFAR